MKLTEETYVQITDNVIQKLIQETKQERNKVGLVTTSKIRNLLAMTAEIYNDVINSTEERLSQEIIGRINYLKVRVVYEAGREPSVKNFVVGAKLVEFLDSINGSRKQFLLFSRYMEALVAYRKFREPKDE